MSNYNTTLQSNNTDLQTILDSINALPDAGVELPTLTNPAAAAEVFANKELIDADGNKIVGTFTIENELTAQDTLIAQIQVAVDNLPEAGGNNSTTSELKIAYVATTDTAMHSNIVVFNQGMTWNDFCNSEYNIRYAKVNGSPQQKTFLCVYSDNSIWDTDNMGFRLATETTDWTIGSDEIIEGNIYIMHYDD